MSTTGQGLDNVAGVANAAVGNDGHARAFQRGADFHHGTQLRNPHAGNDAGGANRPRTDAHFHGVGTGFDQGEGRLSRGDVSGHDVDAAKGLLHVAHGVDHATAVAVGGVHDDRVDASVHQCSDPFVGVGGDAYGCRNAEAAVLVLARVGELAQFDDVAVGDKSHELAVAIHNGKLFNAVFTKDLLRLGEVASIFRDDEVVARHELGDGSAALLFKTQVAVGDDAHEFAGVVGDGNATDFVFAHDGQGVSSCRVLAQGDRVLNHAAL